MFINAAEFSANGVEVYMDVGVVPVESVSAAMKAAKDNPGVPPQMDFHVSHRFGMTLSAAALISQRLMALLHQSATMFVEAQKNAEGTNEQDEQAAS